MGADTIHPIGRMRKRPLIRGVFSSGQMPSRLHACATLASADDVTAQFDTCIMENLLAALTERCSWDCVLDSFDGWNLVLSSGTSEITTRPLGTFAGISYIECPTRFSHPSFRLATTQETTRIASVSALTPGDHVIAIDAETASGLGRKTFFLVAESLDLADAA